MRARIILVAVLATVAAMALPTIASAVDDTTVASVEATEATGTYAPPATDSAASVSCRWWKLTVTAKGVFGGRLWDYWQRIDFCYNGTKVTSADRTRAGNGSATWDFDGHIDSEKLYAVGTEKVGWFTQGKFSSAFVNLVDHDHPWIRMTVYKNGSWTHTHDCNC